MIFKSSFTPSVTGCGCKKATGASGLKGDFQGGDRRRNMSNKKTIPVFFAADEKYIPYLAVAVHSLKENACKQYVYQIYILHADMDCDGADAQKLREYQDENFKISFVDVGEKIDDVKHRWHLRDYYTSATYYRIFIAETFPQYDKALYLDSDIVVLGDISQLFNAELGENLVGAIPDGAVAAVEPFRIYTQKALGIQPQRYFNAGVLLMNLKAFRERGFYQKFCALLNEYKFSVAQDQDYLNVLCKDSVCYLGAEWNKMPIEKDMAQPKLIHYNLTMKPWHYDNVVYQEYFWQYAKKTAFYARILDALSAYSQAEKAQDAESEKSLVQLCVKEAEREDNYAKRAGK